jgi:hypothetical protein
VGAKTVPGGMQTSAVAGAPVETFDILSDNQRLPTPPNSARSFYSATGGAQTASGQQSARTLFFTPQSSPETGLSASPQPSPQHADGRPPLVFPTPVRAVALQAAADEPSASAAQRTPRSLEASKRALGAYGSSNSPFKQIQASESKYDESWLGIGETDATSGGAPARSAPVPDGVASCGLAFRADAMSEAYELIPDLDSPTSSSFHFEAPGGESEVLDCLEAAAAHGSKLGIIRRDEIDHALSAVPTDVDGNVVTFPPAPAPAPAPQQNLILAAMEPAVSMAPPMHISSATEQSCAFSSASEARNSIPLLSSVLLQLQNMHGECNLDVLLTCARLASAHHFIKDFVEAKRLYMKCLQVSSRCACACVLLFVWC